VQPIKPYPRFQNIATYRNNSGTTNYNAAEARVEERLAHGISFLFAYTHSKLIDNASSVFSATVLSSANSSGLVAAETYKPLSRARLIQRRHAQRHLLQQHLRSARRPRTSVRIKRISEFSLGWVVCQCHRFPAIQHARHRYAGHKQQLVRRLCAAAAESCRETEPSAFRKKSGSLLPHRRVLNRSSIHHQDRVAKIRYAVPRIVTSILPWSPLQDHHSWARVVLERADCLRGIDGSAACSAYPRAAEQ
jgi:hypothetical protein